MSGQQLRTATSEPVRKPHLVGVERPVLFQGEMVRAILEGRKTQTRRVIRPQPELGSIRSAGLTARLCPYGIPGDVLWVRETVLPLPNPPRHHWQEPDLPLGALVPHSRTGDRNGYAYRADVTPAGEEIRKEFGWKWKPSIHMPRSACRLRLEVLDVRVERLQNITLQDAIAEGLERREPRDGHWCEWRGADDAGGRPQWHEDPIQAFQSLWNSINAKRGQGWDTNPWVWAVTFRRIKEGS